PKKKAVSRRQTSRRKNKKPVVFNEFKKILVGIIILVSVCITVAMIADLFFHPERIEKKTKIVTKPSDKPEIKAKKAVTRLKEKSDKLIKYEVFEDVDHTIVERPSTPGKDHIPQIAIIIDDIGYDKKIALALCDLNSNITFSVLPFAPFGEYLSGKLHAKGSQLMLHLPMEPVEYPDINPGPGAILSAMSPDVLIDQVRKNIRNIPYIVGVNNHMGSKVTSHSDQMNQIFSILKKENLFFVDSMTAPKSQCKASARLFKLEFAQRDIFLDNIQDTEYITRQFKKLIDLAKKHGSAIGIGHPYEATLQTLSKQLPGLKNKVEIVRVSALTAVPE
ncbi:MAG: divergent polysaccharide deacetylase family protein, partial [Desulfobacterales bacterium]|nr:divergent polysaccharide deacetylase family protein [Desulfobacterales bacterium]